MNKDFEIVKEYMKNKYPDKTYQMQKGNDCVWVSMGIYVSMYFIIEDNKIIDIQVD